MHAMCIQVWGAVSVNSTNNELNCEKRGSMSVRAQYASECMAVCIFRFAFLCLGFTYAVSVLLISGK